MLRAVAVILVLAGCMPNAAYAASEGWDCTYAGFGDPHSKIQVRYQLKADRLYQLGTADIPYRVLENSRIALVAASGGAIPARMAPERGQLIGTSTIIIKKDTGDLVLGNVNWGLHGPTTESTSGVCSSGKL